MAARVMPTTADIRAAIAKGDGKLAQELYEEVLAKNEGRGLSGHDQQLLSEEIGALKKAKKKPEVRGWRVLPPQPPKSGAASRPRRYSCQSELLPQGSATQVGGKTR